MLTRGHRTCNSISLVLVRALGNVFQTEGCQSLPSPGRAALGASLAVPASPRGSRKNLDDLGTMRSKRAEQGNSLKDPSVVGASADTSCIGRPADAED